jgi:hypothetical protein
MGSARLFWIASAMVLPLVAGTDPSVKPPKLVTFEVSRHPSLARPVKLQALFDEGAKLVLTDDDGPGEGTDDDVSFDVSFTITPAKAEKFPDQSASPDPSQSFDYKEADYNEITDFVHLYQLGRAKFAHLMQVESLPDPLVAYAHHTSKTIIFSQAASRDTTVHEWGHSCGLPHRDSSNQNIMHSTATGQECKINADERAAMQSFVNP